MTEHDDMDWTQLARYLAHECSPAERADVERWLASDPRRRDELADVRRWFERAAEVPSAARIDAMWAELSRRMHDADRAIAYPNPYRQPRRPTPVLALSARRAPSRMTSRAVIGAIAASLLLLAGGRLMWRTYGAPDRITPTPSAIREFSTARGQRATIRLLDGTRVELGFGSRLRVSPFTGGRRDLWLEGEAVFDVVHDPARPFIVRAANAVTEDLGTTFGVRAYPGEGTVRVVVVSGKVALRPSESPPGEAAPTAVLGPGQLGRLDAAGQLEVRSGVDTTLYVGWLSGRLRMHDTRLDAIAAELERRFDVAIEIPDPDVAAMRLTIDMSGHSLTEILEAATVPLELRHRRDGARIVVERRFERR